MDESVQSRLKITAFHRPLPESQRSGKASNFKWGSPYEQIKFDC